MCREEAWAESLASVTSSEAAQHMPHGFLNNKRESSLSKRSLLKPYKTSLRKEVYFQIGNSFLRGSEGNEKMFDNRNKKAYTIN